MEANTCFALSQDTTPFFRAVWMTLQKAAEQIRDGKHRCIARHIKGGWKLSCGAKSVFVSSDAVSLGGGRRRAA